MALDSWLMLQFPQSFIVKSILFFLSLELLQNHLQLILLTFTEVFSTKQVNPLPYSLVLLFMIPSSINLPYLFITFIITIFAIIKARLFPMHPLDPTLNWKEIRFKFFLLSSFYHLSGMNSLGFSNVSGSWRRRTKQLSMSRPFFRGTLFKVESSASSL